MPVIVFVLISANMVVSTIKNGVLSRIKPSTDN